MADVVLDANVIVGFLDATDRHHARASALVANLEAQRHESVLLDVTVGEAVSVLCRRSLSGERETGVDLSALLAQVRQWFRDGDITFVHAETERLFEPISTSLRIRRESSTSSMLCWSSFSAMESSMMWPRSTSVSTSLKVSDASRSA